MHQDDDPQQELLPTDTAAADAPEPEYIRRMRSLSQEALSNKSPPNLPIWPVDTRGIPNEFVRSSLFTVRNKRTPRKLLANEQLFALKGIEIKYRGEELRSDSDEEVWLQIMHLASRSDDQTTVEFTPRAFLIDLGWPTTGFYYDRLRECLSRLQATTLSIRSPRLHKTLNVSLVRKAITRDETDDTPLPIWTIFLEEEIRYLFGQQHYTRLQWEERKSLSVYGKRLYDFYSSHREPYPMGLEMLGALCGSNAQTVKNLRRMIRRTLFELQELGFLTDWHIDNRTGVVHVQRNLARRIGCRH